jgi:hypothetical protein
LISKILRVASLNFVRKQQLDKNKNKNLYELHRGINKNRKEWEIEHQLVVIENKCCENKNKNVEV